MTGQLLAIGAIADRTGLAVSAIRFYESIGLISSERAPSGHRRFTRSTIRRISFILVCQQLGYSLAEIAAHLSRLPGGRTPTDEDWSAMAATFRTEVDGRIDRLRTLRDRLDGCIGCGCLSLEHCAMFNPGDAARQLGTGPRYLLGDSRDDLAPPRSRR